jgi:imidazolonepropionase-like amidohydrolase
MRRNTGRFADMVLLDADPLIDVMNLSRVYRVIKAGSVFDHDELIRSIR